MNLKEKIRFIRNKRKWWNTADYLLPVDVGEIFDFPRAIRKGQLEGSWKVVAEPEVRDNGLVRILMERVG